MAKNNENVSFDNPFDENIDKALSLIKGDVRFCMDKKGNVLFMYKEHREGDLVRYLLNAGIPRDVLGKNRYGDLLLNIDYKKFLKNEKAKSNQVKL